MEDGPRILIVEDDYLIAALLEDIMKAAGWRVVGPVSRVAEAVDTAAHQDCDAAVLDVNLAGEPIYPVAEVLSRRKVPFMFLTGYGDEALEDPFGERPRLGKPFRTKELLGALARLVKAPAEA
jgi:DNA-binding response OmpR family regulator